ncbi:hypothetical protein [Methylobacterium aquaticum]|uniref:hypothetical protein n=1 Tax=Methylobacterium aquaticum TaxID=270351 RepID=UPI001931EBF5|nr:hypothetical protein [Methylobacterium aquaticum]QRE77487.1 hypothetical protein F1D61_31690 [Methylobacterium aquaticum]
MSEIVSDVTRYAIRRDRAGWTVYDLRSGAVAVIGDVLQIGLDRDEAESVAEAFSDGPHASALAGVLPRFAWFQAPARP